MSALALAAETGSIEGQPLDGDGTPCEGAPIPVFRFGEKRLWKRVAATDQEGRYSLTVLPPGRDLLRHGPRPEPQSNADNPFRKAFEGRLGDAMAPAFADKSRADAIAIEPGQTVRRDIRLPKRAPASLGNSRAWVTIARPTHQEGGDRACRIPGRTLRTSRPSDFRGSSSGAGTRTISRSCWTPSARGERNACSTLRP